MESKQICDILKQLNENDTYKKIFINGVWGIGKSFYADEYKKNHNDNIVYVSLFGKNSFESIVNSLSKEFMKKLKGFESTKKKITKFIKKFQGSLSYNGISINSPIINNKSLLEEYSKLLKKKELIIIIDDLERKSVNIPIEDIMGLIEEFSLIERVKIAIIGDETNINDDEKEKWKKFKEKLIEKEYKIDTFSEESIESIVIKKLNNYISEDSLKNYISNFLNKHKVKNLRTINKGINLFDEIVNNYLEQEYDEDVNLIILKNCMSVSIEYTEQLYKPNEEDKDSTDTLKFISYNTNLEMPSRIMANYFNSAYTNTRESSILEYVIKFYNTEISDEVIDEFNNVLKNYVSVKKEKSIFYLSEKDIISKLKEIYTSIKSEKYKVKTLEEFIDDIYTLLNYNKKFSMKYNSDLISNHVYNILFHQYYNVSKEEYHNKIDEFSLVKYESPELNEIIKTYNNKVTKKYVIDKIDYIIEKYKNNDLDINCLIYLKDKFIQSDSKYSKDYFFKCCKENNFLLPNLEGEIEESDWSWTHHVWTLFYKYLEPNYKKELNDYVNKIKLENKLIKYRIDILQKNKPLT